MRRVGGGFELGRGLRFRERRVDGVKRRRRAARRRSNATEPMLYKLFLLLVKSFAPVHSSAVRQGGGDRPIEGA